MHDRHVAPRSSTQRRAKMSASYLLCHLQLPRCMVSDTESLQQLLQSSVVLTSLSSFWHLQCTRHHILVKPSCITNAGLRCLSDRCPPLRLLRTHLVKGCAAKANGGLFKRWHTEAAPRNDSLAANALQIQGHHVCGRVLEHLQAKEQMLVAH